MKEEEIIDKALENLEKQTQIMGKWAQNGPKELDGQLTLTLENERLKFNTEIKTELRNHLIPQILEYNQRFDPFMLVVGRIFPKIKEQLRQHNVAYLEANGNFFLKKNQKWFFIDNNPPLPVEQDNRNRAFTKTGLKVLFEFLLDKKLITQPYRQIAEYTQTAVGGITNIIQGLKQEGFVVPLNKNEIKLINKEELIRKWVEAYEYTLKPTLKIGTFRMADQTNTWQDLRFNLNRTRWGGEPAGDILTNYLRPEDLILYTEETRNDLIKNYRLIPDENGKVKAYKKFWLNQEDHETMVPPLLTYADLMNTNEKRCRETAQKIYDDYIRPNL
ncbi:hypothetical protein SanaruYs_15500 [Chryseotalea sanaruensis]|uniref:Uncharacterized protein n=1 Tax=Chryseotalea sanaruensis TaxID=2482724 RepID=A0A401U8X4_9BACT|nr:type IV toxin-antitoxin system AbiEi family antitoxin [Chryseotalea sanaruensis]GCC51327.1 hypothetical protein SanaruYs_15500 [Chryseotalea sanaruensis]